MQSASFSQLNSWLRCGKAYYLQRIAQAPERQSVWLVSGTALHEGIERINLNFHERGSSGSNTN